MSGETPRISVLLTVHKRVEYLREALTGVLAQTCPDYEVIVADDSGEGVSRRIVEDYENARRVRYLQNPGTLGIASSLARAVKESRGEFITILNDDDVWEKNLLAELIVPLLADPSRVAAFSDHSVMDRTGRTDPVLSDRWSANTGRLGLPEGVVRDPVEFTVVKPGIPVANCALFRKDAVDWSLVVPQVSGAYDYWISCLLVATGRPIYYVPKRLARYRLHEEMETHRRRHDKGENSVYIFTAIRERGWFRELDPVIKARLAEALLAAARNKLHFGRFREARQFFWRCFFLSLRPRALAGAVGTFLPGSARDTLSNRDHAPERCGMGPG
jgi:glycosyltransferase involved in cell wall biosynthesis